MYGVCEFDKKIKLILVGDSCVGKSTFFNVLKNGDFTDSQATIGVDFQNMIKTINDEIIKICIWDTAGQEKYKSIIRSYFRDIAGIILMFDLTKRQTFLNIQNWLNLIESENKCNHSHPILLLGNKRDLYSNDDDELDNLIKEWSNKEFVIYKEISCFNNNRVYLEALLNLLIQKIITSHIECKGVINYNYTYDNTYDNTFTIKKKIDMNCCNIF